MWCRWIQRDLTALIDEELSPSRAQRVRRHVVGCEACRNRLAALERVVHQQSELLPLLGAAVQAPTEEMLRRVRAGIRPEQEVRRWWLSPQFVAAVAASIVAVFGLLRISQPFLMAVGLEDPPEIVVENPELFRDYSLFEHLDAIERLGVGSAPASDSRG